MSARIAALELRRGSGLLLFLILGALGAAYTMITALEADSILPWSSNGPGIATWLNSCTMLLGPVAAAVSAWVGGREKRLGVEELLVVVVRPRWQRAAASLAVLVAAVVAALLVVAVVAAAAVAATLSYGGGRWVLSVFVVLLGLVVCVALGFAVGRLWPHRWTAALVGVAVYLLAGVTAYLSPAKAQLSPIANLAIADGWRLRLNVAAWVVCWLLAITVTAFVVSTARRRRWALAAAVVAALAAVPLLAQPVQWSGGTSFTAAWTEKDPAALDRICTTDTPTVCVRRTHAGLLPAVTPVAREVLVRLPAGTLAVEEDPQVPSVKPPAATGEVVMPFLSGRARPFTADLLDARAVRREILDNVITPRCPETSDASLNAMLVAYSLLTRNDTPPETDARTRDMAASLQADAEAGKVWMGRYLEAGRTCDMPAFDDLVRR